MNEHNIVFASKRSAIRA